MKKSNYSKINFALFIAFLAVIISHPIHAQVGIGTTSPDASAVLDIQSSSNDKGILIPRMTQAQRNSISSPATGLMIFQTDGNVGFYFYDGSSWESFGEVKTVNGNSPAADGNVTLTFLATQTGTQAQRAATASPTDGLVHIVTGDPTPSENDKVYIYSTGLASWTLSSGFTDTDEQDISGSSFTVATSALLIDIEDGSGQTLDLSALEELVNDTDPATNLGGASQGDLAYDTTDDELQVYDGSSWVPVSSSVVTPTLDQVTDVGSSTTNGIDVGSLTVNSQFTLPTATGTAGQYLTVSTTTSELVFATPAAVVTPTLDQVTDVGSSTTNGIDVGSLTVNSQFTLPTATGTAGQYLTVSTTTSELVFATPAAVVTPTLDQVTDVGSSTTNGIDVGSLTVNSAFTLPTATGTAGQYLTVSTTTSELVFATPAAVVTPTLDQVTDVGSSTTNGIDVGSLTVNSQFTLPTATGTAGQYLTVSTTTSELVFATPAAVVTPTLDQVTDVGSSTTNGIDVGSLTVNSQFTLPTATGTAGQYLTVSTTTSELVFATPAAVVTPTLDQVTDVGSSTTNGIDVGSLTVNSAFTLPTATGTAGQYLTVSTTTSELVFATPAAVVTPTLDQVTDVGSSTTNGIDVGSLTVNSQFTLPTATGTAGQYLTVSTTTSELVFATPAAVVTPTLDQVTDVGSSTTNGIDVGSLTVNSQFTLPTATGTAGQYLTVSTTTSELVFATPAAVVTPTLDQVTDVGSSTTNGIDVGSLTVNSAFTLPTATGTAGQYLTVSTTTSELVFATPAAVVTPTLDQVTDVGSSTTNGIDVGSLTVNSAFTLPTATGTAGQYLTVSTTTSELVFATPAAVVTPTLDQVTDVGSTTTNSIEVGGATVTGDLTVNTNTTLEGNTTIGDTSSDDVTISARLDSDLIPKSDDSRSLGSSSLNFNTVNTLNVTSNAGMTVSSTAKLTLNTSATGTPTISLQQGGTEMAGIGSSTFFIGDSTSGNHYFFPQTGGSLGQVLAFTNTNTLELYSVDNLEQDTLDSVAKRGATTNEPLNINTMTVSTSINVMTNANLGTGTSTDTTVTIGDDSQDVLDIKADLRSNLSMDGDNLYDIGSLTKNVRNVYSRALVSNSDLSLNVSNTADDDIFFQQSGTTKAGVNSSTFYIGRDSNRYEFPQIAPATVNNQVLAYTATNSITFITIAGTTTPTLDQVTDVGSTTTNSIEVGGATVTGDLTVSVTTSLNGTTAIGDATTDDVTISARLDSDLIPKSDDSRSLGSSSLNFNTVNTLNVTSNSAMTVSSTGILTLSTSATGTPTISLQQGGTEMAGIGSSTFFIGDSTSGNQYFFPQETGTAGQVLTVSTTTSELVFTTIASLPTGTTTGTVLRYNPATSSWEETELLKVNPGGTFANNITVSNTLVPLSNKTIDLGKTSYEFSNVFSQKIETSENDLEFRTNGQSIYLKRDSDNLVIQDNTTAIAGANQNNVAVGLSTLNPSSSGAQENSAFGYSTLSSLTNGSFNTALGSQSLYNLTTGNGNVAIGYYALNDVATTSYNVGIGHQAGDFLTGSENIAIGTTALRRGNSSSSQNVAIGREAMAGTTTSGNDNVALGYRSIYNNTSGSRNVALGRESLLDNTQGNGNVALGFRANQNNTEGNYNVSIGRDALETNTTGDENIAIGYQADVASNNLSNAVSIGSGAIVNSSNTIRLGNEDVTSLITSGTLTLDAITYPNITGTAGQVLTVSTTTSELVFTTIAGTTTPTLDQVTDVGSTTTNSIEVGGATVTGDLTVSVTTSLNGTTAIGDATTDDVTISARLDSDLIPKSDDSRSLGSSSLNFNTVNTLNVTSNAGMTVSSTAKLTLNTSATGTPTISLQQGGTEMAGIGSSTFFIGDSTSGNHYFFPQNTGIPGQVLTVSTTTSNLVFTSSGLLPAGSANGDIIHYSGTQWERTDELSVPFGGSGPILSNRSLDPRVDDTHDIGDASAIFSRGYFREINSGSGSVSLTFNTSATGTPTISFQQGGTEMAGIGSSTFFIGDSTSGNHYFFPSSTQTSTFSQVLTYDSSNASNTLYWSDFVLISPGSNDGAVLKWNNTSQRWVENTDIKLDDSAYSDDITLGASIIPRASNLSIGRASDRFENVYTNAINSNTSSLTISTSATGTPTISFQQGGTELAGIGSSTFFIGDSTSGDHYFFPQETGTAGQVLTVSSTTNQLVFTTSDSLPTGTTTGTVLRYNPATSSWEETELLKVNPGGSFANNITVSNTLVPITNNTLDLGKTSYEFSKIFSRNLTTATPSLTFSIDGDNIYFKLKDVSAGYGSIFLTSQTAEQNQQGVTVIGADSYLTTATSSNYNTAFGFKNLTNSSLIGSYNVILGSKNLTSLTSGNGNIAIGDSAAASLATGDNIIAIGRQALNASTDADNIGIGNDALLNNTSGSANLAIGKSALSSNTLYDNNIALGNRALIDNSSSNNTAVGKDALDFENTGGNNTAIGYAADINNSSIANSTVIGANATVTTSNTIRLGDSNVTSLITSGTLTLDGVTYPNATGTAGQVLTVSSTTSELVFTSIGALPSGTATGTTLRYNYGSSAWEETNVLTIAPGGAWGDKIAVRQSIIPQIDNSLDLGHSSYEFADVNTRNISTSTSSISINIDGFSAELYEDSNVLTLKNVEKFETASSSLTFELSGKSMHLKTTANENYEFNNYPNVSTGSRNTSFGSAALRPSAASYSTAIGYASLNASALSGNYNTAYGYYSSNQNTTGEKNTSIGSEAAKDNTTGSNNVTIGYRAAFDSSDIGSNNVIIGSESVPTTSTVGDQNVVIGATAEVAASINNAIAIGYGATNSNSNSIQLGNSSITSVETSGVVSATGFETTGTATITTLTVGDSSKYTLPAATGTAGQVLTVSSTTSELVFADVTSTYSPTYLLAQAVDNQSVTSTQYMTFQSPLASNGISITTSNTINLPSGKIYKLTAFVSATSSNSGARTMSYQFRTSGSYYGTQGRFAASQKESYPSNNVPATAIVDCTTAGAAIVLELNINMSQNVEGRSHVIVEEL